MQENIIGTLPIGRLLVKVSVPLILSMLCYALYGIADSIFIARLGTDYTGIVCIFSFVLTFQVMLERILVAVGKSCGSMVSLMTGTLLNLTLDPVLMFGFFGIPAMGIRGAAFATVISQIAAAVIAFMLNLKMNKAVRFKI